MKTPPALSEARYQNAAPFPRRSLFEVIARWWPVELLVLLVLPVIMLSLAAVVSYQMPAVYESSTLIEINPLPDQPLQAAEAPLTPEYLATQAGIIRAGGCLQQVIDNLELATQWNLESGAASVNELKRRLAVTVLPNTYLIRITARAANACDASDIARETATAYRQTRQEAERQAGFRQLLELKKAVRTQEDTVEQTRKVLSNIARARQMVVGADGAGPPDDRGLATLRAKQMELEFSKASLAGQIKGLEKDPFEQLLAHAKSAGAPDAVISRDYLRYLQAQQLAEERKDDVSEVRDPLAQQRDALRDELDDRVTVLKATLRGELALTTAKLETVRSQADALAKQLVADSLGRSDYLDAQTTFQRETGQLERMQRQLIDWEVWLGTAWEPARICEEPSPAQRPASPDIRRIFRRATAFGLLAGLLAMVPFALLLEGFSSNRSRKRQAAPEPTPPPAAA